MTDWRSLPRGLATITLTTLLLSACSTSDDPAPVPTASSPRPSSLLGGGVTPSASGVSRPSMPLDVYRLRLSEFRAIQVAQSILINRCMGDFGFPPSAPAPAPAGGGDEFGSPFPYFIEDVDVARAVGYHTALLPQFKAEVSQLATAQAAAKRFNESLGSRAESYGLVFSGETPSGQPFVGDVAGKRVPQGGCAGQATASLYGSTTPETPGSLAGQLVTQAWTQAKASPAVVAAFADWSRCMAAKGFRYKTPAEANNDTRWSSPAPSESEIATALADVECKGATQLVTTWRSEDEKLQRNLVEQNAVALTDGRRAIDDILKKASDDTRQG